MVVGAAAACCCGHSHSHSPFLLARIRGSFRAVNANARDTQSESESESAIFRSQKLAQLDEELRLGDDKAALFLVRDLQGHPTGRGLHCFGAARQVPQRLYTLDELKLNGIDTSSFLAPVDQTLGSIERILQLAFALAAVSARFAFDLSQLQLLFITLALLFVWTVDQISFNGGVRNLLLDTIGHTLSHKYHSRVIQHEAGHFIIAYLLGVLPKSYTITSLETLTKEGSLNVQAGTAFVDFEFLEEINSGKVSAKMLNRFSCIALAGVATEYLLYGYSEGGLGDIAKLDALLKSLGFTQKKADSQVRWAVLNTILILRRHEKARLQLAVAMSDGKSVGSCIDVIESNIDFEDI
ncbi:translation initiation factor 3 subunit I [Rhynchospora pubera]|uniref:Translation initiation factor 3 subunit I n=1 Tax=Rhynchospora pubera TaxID=906938 RepID=A0AAV8D9V3_9POAL|nr:translation initiation factor 3 subunit I [Rhynchospora pubera]